MLHRVAAVPSPVMLTAETQTQWPHEDGLLGRPFVFTSMSGECYNTAIHYYGLRSVDFPHRLRSCNCCGCASPKFSDRRR